jgi:NAD(P)-dependent dehydrogenase (short-subunit alcohol dehydrogenase family)
MNKIAVITGGAGGIGQAVAVRLARGKQTVVILDISDDAGAKVAAEFHKRGIPVAFYALM